MGRYKFYKNNKTMLCSIICSNLWFRKSMI